MDFIIELPLSSRHNTVMTVVDSVSKWAHFIPMHMTVTVEGVARPFLYQVWKLYSLPKCIILDHSERVQKGIAHWDKQNNDVPAPNCMLKVQEEIIKVEGL